MNYGQLQAMVADYLHREDLAERVKDWISLAGKRIDRDCRLSEMEYRASTVGESRYVLLPLDYLSMRNIQAGGVPITYLTPEQLDRIRLAGAQARYYTIVDNQLELYPAPTTEAPLELEVFYFARNPVLVNDADTNKVLTAFPQLYLYAALIEAMPYLVDDAGLTRWSDLYRAEVDALNDAAQEGRYSGNLLQVRAF